MLALPSKAALCSPERLVDKQFQGILERIKDIFPEQPVGVKSVRVTKNELHDYAKVAGRMHQCGKLAFMLHPKGSPLSLSLQSQMVSKDPFGTEQRSPRPAGDQLHHQDLETQHPSWTFALHRDHRCFFQNGTPLPISMFSGRQWMLTIGLVFPR